MRLVGFLPSEVLRKHYFALLGLFPRSVGDDGNLVSMFPRSHFSQTTLFLRRVDEDELLLSLFEIMRMLTAMYRREGYNGQTPHCDQLHEYPLGDVALGTYFGDCTCHGRMTEVDWKNQNLFQLILEKIYFLDDKGMREKCVIGVWQ